LKNVLLNYNFITSLS